MKNWKYLFWNWSCAHTLWDNFLDHPYSYFLIYIFKKTYFHSIINMV